MSVLLLGLSLGLPRPFRTAIEYRCTSQRCEAMTTADMSFLKTGERKCIGSLTSNDDNRLHAGVTRVISTQVIYLHFLSVRIFGQVNQGLSQGLERNHHIPPHAHHENLRNWNVNS